MLVALTLSLSGCVTTQKIIISPLERPALNLPNPQKFTLDHVHWYTLSQLASPGAVGSTDDFWKEMNKQFSTSGVAISPDDFRKILKNETKLKIFIQEQEAIIAAYKKYYIKNTVH